MAGIGVTWEAALAWRLGRQLLTSTPAVDTAAAAPADESGPAVEAARRLAGVQAQLASSAELAIGIRTGVVPPVVRRALWDERSLVKTWAMRGTLHLFPADELPLWVAALRAKERVTRRTEGWERYHRVTVAQLEAVTASIGRVLGAEPLTRVELAAAVVADTGDASLGPVVEASFGGSILKSAAANGDLCFGPDRGRNVTFVRPERWLGGWGPEPPAGEALEAVVGRFLDAYGPATEEDVARWWGVPPAQGRRIVRDVAAQLVPVTLDGARAWLTPAGADGVAATRTDPPGAHVRLLPSFDVFVLAPHSHRRHTWPEGLHERISRAAGWISPTLVVDGHVRGVWSHARAGGVVRVEIEPLGPVRAPERRAAETHAHAYEPLVGAPIEVRWVDRPAPSSR